ncbi:hypothetical protein LEP1GSC125_2291 [Leptospira mayottensis 200901122]|uniref:Uncharacterized protein n=1 Tax=Leptospira mayottensis 200901122 TaxID=1193010 RepID=A0AA87SWX6_9LEPT|nr:hypothetical protein LEP1GSC125_2291 [Leptospira mayottensis 200901122]
MGNPKLSSLDGIERASGLVVLNVERNQDILDLCRNFLI